MLTGNSPVVDLLGIGVGHLYFFLEDVYPRYTDRHVLKTPSFIRHLFHAGDLPQPQPIPEEQNVWGGPGVQLGRGVGANRD